MRGEGKAACAAFFGRWFAVFPDAHVEIQAVHFFDDVAVGEATFTETHNGVFSGPIGEVPLASRIVRADYIRCRFDDGKHVSFELMTRCL